MKKTPLLRDTRGRFVKPAQPQTQNVRPVSSDSITASSKNNEHDTMHQTLREVNRIAAKGHEPSVEDIIWRERWIAKTLHALFVLFVWWVVWMLFLS